MKLGAEHLLECLENWALRSILRPNSEEVTGIWRDLYNGKHL